jgi:nitroreductase
MGNEVLDAIMQRHSIYQFKPEAVPTEKIASILEAGRWAPSYANTQPWEFITVTDSKLKQEVV